MAEQYTNRAYGSKHTSARKRRRKRSNIGKKTALIITITVIIAAVIILIGMQIGKKPNVLVGTWVYDEHTQYIFEKSGKGKLLADDVVYDYIYSVKGDRLIIDFTKDIVRDCEYLNNLILKYLVSFPLRAACSISVISRNVPFIEEYIFPQQLLLWLRDKSDFDGILYRTCSAIESAYNWNYINLVMPAKYIRGSYCENLTHIFELTPPVKVDVNKSLLKYSNKIDDVKKCLKMIESKYYNGYSLYPYRELIAISKNFIMLYDMLLSDNYQNAPTVYQTLQTLILSANMICKSKDNIKATAMAEAKDLFYNVNEDLISNEFDVVFQEFQIKVQPALNDFFHLAFIIYENHMINYDEFESI